VRHGHGSQTSIDAENTGKLAVIPDVSNTEYGTITVVSQGYLFDEQPCEETYTFDWTIVSTLSPLAMSDSVEIGLTASGESTPTPPTGECPGSQDGTIAAGGVQGTVTPLFMQDEPWKYFDGIETYTDATGPAPAWGFSEFYPQETYGVIQIPLNPVDEAIYADYMAFRINVTVSSNVAQGVIEYGVVYVYERVRKDKPRLSIDLIEILNSPLRILKTIQYRVCIANNGPGEQTYYLESGEYDFVIDRYVYDAKVRQTGVIEAYGFKCLEAEFQILRSSTLYAKLCNDESCLQEYDLEKLPFTVKSPKAIYLFMLKYL
jgi:hypothetical protein